MQYKSKIKFHDLGTRMSSTRQKVFLRNSRVFKADFCAPSHSLCTVRLNRPSGSSDDDFIFVRDGERITSRQINYVLEKACTKLGIPVKRSHKIRKTVASRLSAGNVPLDSIREILGHSNLSTTLGYIYNPLSEKETYVLMSKAL